MESLAEFQLSKKLFLANYKVKFLHFSTQRAFIWAGLGLPVQKSRETDFLRDIPSLKDVSIAWRVICSLHKAASQINRDASCLSAPHAAFSL